MDHVRGRWNGVLRLGPDCILALPEMDEALFRLPGLLDYRVTVSRERDGRFRLHVDVYRAEGGSPTDRDVLEMLSEVDAIRKGIARANLEIPTAHFSADGRWTTTGVSKRKIVTTSDPPA
jgi:hypothetical protein